MRLANPWPLISAFRGLGMCSSSLLQSPRPSLQRHTKTLDTAARLQNARLFSTTGPVLGSWLEPSLDRKKKMAKGRARVATGGSMKGTTVIWGDWGLRMIDHHRRISAKQLKMAEDTIKVRLRGEKFRLYKRKCCNVGVYVSGNEVRPWRLQIRDDERRGLTPVPDANGQRKRLFRPLGDKDVRESSSL